MKLNIRHILHSTSTITAAKLFKCMNTHYNFFLYFLKHNQDRRKLHSSVTCVYHRVSDTLFFYTLSRHSISVTKQELRETKSALCLHCGLGDRGSRLTSRLGQDLLSLLKKLPDRLGGPPSLPLKKSRVPIPLQ